MTRFRGYTVEEALNLSLEDSLTQDSAELAKRILGEELEKEKDPGAAPDSYRIFELQFLHKDGSLVWGELTSSFTRDEEGRITGIQGVTRDITDRMRAEDDLKDSEERFTSSVASQPWIVDFLSDEANPDASKDPNASLVVKL